MTKNTDKPDLPKNYDPKTGSFKLDFPFEGNGQPFETLTLKRFNMAIMKKARTYKDTDDRNEFFLMKSTGMAPDDFDKIDAADAAGMMDVISTFF